MGGGGNSGGGEEFAGWWVPGEIFWGAAGEFSSGPEFVMCSVPSLSVNCAIFAAVAGEAQINHPKANMQSFNQDMYRGSSRNPRRGI
jgi:hypothetical protein